MQNEVVLTVDSEMDHEIEDLLNVLIDELKKKSRSEKQIKLVASQETNKLLNTNDLCVA